ncbi:hypothetical protein CEXT_813111 [Caerostris extrusa]|uniref:Uncharacterized protein n=1 Tax=Caerostris extrusa TaxID=172846 RepID=A0AAV4R0P9_CAEEX|nr:hypothetical protein CEXT_813111 [Caerostris extrusa]
MTAGPKRLPTRGRGNTLYRRSQLPFSDPADRLRRYRFDRSLANRRIRAETTNASSTSNSSSHTPHLMSLN